VAQIESQAKKRAGFCEAGHAQYVTLQLHDAPRIRLAVRDENERWGEASSDLVELIDDDRALALVTLFHGNIAHQAEQVANKLSVPVLTLTSDPTTTSINIPWIFRLGPSDIDQAQTIATALSGPAARILVVYENDHDGRTGKRSGRCRKCILSRSALSK
jgi:ABC-type branched-subunit amino acid transport system substrate-binding protein